MFLPLLALSTLAVADESQGPQFALIGSSIQKIQREGDATSISQFNGLEWKHKVASGPMRSIFTWQAYIWTSGTSADSTVITAYHNRNTGGPWEAVPKRHGDHGPFTPLFLGMPQESRKYFGTVGTGESARLAFYETRRHVVAVSNPPFYVKRGWRSLLMVEEGTGVMNTEEGLKTIHLQGDNTGFRASLGEKLPDVPDGIATDHNGNALMGAPMGNMFFFVDKKGQLGQFFINANRQWVYKNQETPPRGWTVLAKSRPVPVWKGLLAVQIEHRDKGLEGFAFKSFKGGEWHWLPQTLSLPEGVKFDPKVDLYQGDVGEGFLVVYGVGEDGNFYRCVKTPTESWKFEGPYPDAKSL